GCAKVDAMTPRSRYTRRAFIGLAAAAGVAGVGACSGAPAAGNRRPVSHRSTVNESSLPGNPHWDIRQLGAPNAMLGYAGQASVLPGQAITLYASTTARSFTVSAFRMGWYGGDLARLVWRSGTVRG